MDDHHTRGPRIAFALILLLFILYAGGFVLRTSFVVGGLRYFCLFDDAMISMRYARNLVDGYGPVWNPGGDKVEGYTNPLWTAYMAVLHLLPVPEAKVSLLVQISSAVFLLGNLFVVCKLARFLSGGSTSAWLGAIVLTAFYLPLNAWSLLGMEVGAATLLVSLAVWMAVKCMADHRFAPGLYLLMGLGVLVRMDLLIPSAIICAFLAVAEKQHRHRHWMAGLVALGAGLAIQTGFRVVYYGDWLPNTYYLKMTGYPVLLRISRGILVLWDFIRNMNPILFLLPFLLLLLRRDRYVTLLLLVFCGQLGYSVYVGGDAWEWWGGSNRYVSIAMPLFFVLFCCTADAIVVRLAERMPPASRSRAGPLVRRSYVTTILVVLGLLSFNALKGPGSLRQWALLDPPALARDNRHMVQRALILRDLTRPEAKVALVWAGIMPYFADRRMIDISGKNDRYIARLPMHTAPSGPGFDYFLPGHLKWDYTHCIGRLRPDVVLQAGYPPGEAEKCLGDEYRQMDLEGYKFHFRRQSPHILWSKIPAGHTTHELAGKDRRRP